MTENQHIAFIEIMKHISEPELLYEEDDEWQADWLCLQYPSFDLRISQTGNAYITHESQIRQTLVYDFNQNEFKLNGFPIDVMENISSILDYV